MDYFVNDKFGDKCGQHYLCRDFKYFLVDC